MINNKKVLALIPARGGSKGLSRKNIMTLNGKPLLGWPIKAAKGSQYIDKIVVSTDDREILIMAIEQGADAPFLRPAHLATDRATSFSVAEHAISYHERLNEQYNYIILLEPTSPLTQSRDIDEALELLDSNRHLADSIVSVSKVESCHPAFLVSIANNGIIQPFVTEKISSTLRRQEISELYFFDGSLYISDIKIYLKKKSFIHERTLPYIMPKWKAFEIDDIVDYVCVEAIMMNVNKIIEGF